MSLYFCTENLFGKTIKFRLVYAGKTSNDKDWYRVECKDVNSSVWERGLSGTEEFLKNMSEQDKEWARKNGAKNYGTN